MILDWSRATVLSLTEFDVSWELLDLGETPVQLDPPSPGRTVEERRRIVAAVGRDMSRRGLGDDRGPHPMLAEQLRVLARAELVLDVRIRAAGLVAGVAACQGSRCSVAVRHRSEIALLSLPADAANSALVELTGSVQPGPGAAVTLPVDVLDAARAAAPDDPQHFAEELVRRGVAPTDATWLVRMCSGVRQRGQFGAAASLDGRRRRAPYVVGTHCTEAGHYRQVRRRTRTGALVTVGPTSGPQLLADLADLAAAARARPGRSG